MDGNKELPIGPYRSVLAQQQSIKTPFHNLCHAPLPSPSGYLIIYASLRGALIPLSFLESALQSSLAFFLPSIRMQKSRMNVKTTPESAKAVPPSMFRFVPHG